MHSLGYIHRDIKPANIIFKENEYDEEEDILYLIDFGLCFKYVDKDGRHIKEEIVKGFKGNLLYSSIHALNRKSKYLNKV